MKREFFYDNGAPVLLEPCPEISGKLLTIEQVEEIMEHNQRAIIRVSGDCLEAVRVVDGGWVAVDFTRFPAPPRHRSKGGDGSKDICLCYAVFPGQIAPAVMIKAYDGVWGTWQMVGTRYDLTRGGNRMDYGMEAKKIFGVAYASWNADGKLLWQRDPHSFPKQLGTTPTIHSENIGDPVPLPDWIAATGCWGNKAVQTSQTAAEE